MRILLKMKRKFLQYLIVGWLTFITAIPMANANTLEVVKQTSENLYDDVLCDFSIYFGKDNLLDLGAVFLGIGIMANTGIDRTLSTGWQKGIRSHFTDSFFQVPNGIGKFNYVATYLGTIAIGHWQSDTIWGNTLYQWGYRSIRTLLLVGIQDPVYGWLIGNGRPNYGKESSKWKLFNRGGKSGCSGHSFNGAIPFITAAMMTDEPLLKFGFYALSTLPALSRINNNAHFPSQVILAWSLAYLSARSVDMSESARDNCPVRVLIMPTQKGGMIQASLSF